MGSGRVVPADILALGKQKITLGGSQRSLNYRHCQVACVYDMCSHIKLMTKRFLPLRWCRGNGKNVQLQCSCLGEKQQQLSVLARKSADLRSVFLRQEKAQAAALQKWTCSEVENPALQKGACCSAELVRSGLRCITEAYQKWHLVIFNENNHLSVMHQVA